MRAVVRLRPQVQANLCLLALPLAALGFGPSPPANTDTLHVGESLKAGQQLTSGGGMTKFVVEGDGNLVLYQTSYQTNTPTPAGYPVLWSSSTHTPTGAGLHLDFQGDGNLVLYSDPLTPHPVVWASNTSSATELVAQSDCNMVLRDSALNALWATNTSCRPAPGPAPGPLPPLPQKLWFGMWGSNLGGSANPFLFSSVIWDDIPSDATIQQYGGPASRFLYPTGKFFCKDFGETGLCTLLPDFQARWDAGVPQMRALLQSQKILGFFLGDELTCGGKRGADAYKAVVTMANAVRSSFPRGSAIIYTNECGSLYGTGVKVPDAIDWISIDHYRKDAKPGFISQLKKDYYEDRVYPMMAPHQKVGIVPQVGHPKDNTVICSDSCTAKVELQDAKDAVAWAKGDPRVALIAPYAWRRDGKVEVGLDQLGDNGDLKNYWITFGKGTRGNDTRFEARSTMDNATVAVA